MAHKHTFNFSTFLGGCGGWVSKVSIFWFGRYRRYWYFSIDLMESKTLWIFSGFLVKAYIKMNTMLDYSPEYMKFAFILPQDGNRSICPVFSLLFFFSISCFSASIKMCQWVINPSLLLLQCQWDLLTESLCCQSDIRHRFKVLIYLTCANQGHDFCIKSDSQ